MCECKNFARNFEACTCHKKGREVDPCVMAGMCCECVRHHRDEKENTPVCLRPRVRKIIEDFLQGIRPYWLEDIRVPLKRKGSGFPGGLLFHDFTVRVTKSPGWCKIKGQNCCHFVDEVFNFYGEKQEICSWFLPTIEDWVKRTMYGAAPDAMVNGRTLEQVSHEPLEISSTCPDQGLCVVLVTRNWIEEGFLDKSEAPRS